MVRPTPTIAHSSNGGQYQTASPVDDDASSSSEPVNQLNAQMQALMQRGGGMQKLKLLRRAKDDQPGHPPGSRGGRDAPADSPLAAKTAEQREREYEEMRAAIFGGQIDGLRQSASASPSGARNGKGASAESETASPNGGDADSAPPLVQPSAAALAEVHHHHSKRSEAHHARGKRGGGGAAAQNHRIIEDLVGNRSGGSARQAPPEVHDPDFGRRSRAHVYQPAQAYAPLSAPMMSYPQQPGPGVGSVGPGNAYFAAGPQGNSIGFGRGQRMQQQQRREPTTFNPHAAHFNPAPMQVGPPAHAGFYSQHPPQPQQSYAPAPYATPNVYMGAGPPQAAYARPNAYDNYYLQQEAAAAHAAAYAHHPAGPTSGPPAAGPYVEPAIIRITHPSLSNPTAQPPQQQRPHSTPALRDQDEFPSLGGATAADTAATNTATAWKPRR